MIKNNEERIARGREVLAASRQELRRARRVAEELTGILYPPGDLAIVRLRSGEAEIGWNTRTPPAVGTRITRDGRRWTVMSVTVIEEHGYRITARGTGLPPEDLITDRDDGRATGTTCSPSGTSRPARSPSSGPEGR